MIALLVSLGISASSFADDSLEMTRTKSDAAALNHLFGDETIQQNAVEVLRQIRPLPLDQQYDELSQWVLPSQGHGIRIGGTIGRPAGKTAEIADRSVTVLADFPERNWIHSPARELISVAVQLDRAAVLKQTVAALQPADDEQRLAQVTLLTLLDIAAAGRNRVAQHLAERFAKTRSWQDANATEQAWSDLLVLWAAAENPQTIDLVIEDLFGAFADLHDFIPDPKLDLITDYLCLLSSYAAVQKQASSQSIPETFDVFSRVDASAYGRGSVLTRFARDDRGIVKISGREVDYFAYRTPLAGDYEVVADVATHEGAFSELVANGIAARPSDEQLNASIGSFAKGNWQADLTDPLGPVGNESFLRATGSGNKTEHHFNGRRLFVDSDATSSAPWIAIRGWRRSIGHLSEFRITGNPEIPRTIDLLTDPSLRGWASYYDPDENDGLGSWHAHDVDGKLELVSERSNDLTGSHDENLLVYVRPIVWDAKITYEFLYRDGADTVFPCIGQTVFQIRPSGVSLHQLSAGRFQQSALRPDNSVPLESQTQPNLIEGWNQVELQFQKNRIRVLLNGERVADKELGTHDSRTFGLFHYRDQTRASVRNVRLSGDWPTTLPDVDEQSLAPAEVNRLESAAAALANQWTHQFRDGLPSDHFHVDGETSLVTQMPEGVHMVRTSPAEATRIKFCGIIDGDFDITLGFRDLQIGDQKPTWHCGLGMAVHLRNERRSRLDICLRRDRLNSLHHIAFSHNEVNEDGGINWISDSDRRDVSSSGRLRLVRKGETIHGLFAEGDSSLFQWIGSAEIPAGPMPPLSLSIYSVGGEGMHVSGTWTDLSIRAEKLDLLQPNDPAQTLKELNQARSSKQATEVDLAKQTMFDAGLLVTSGGAESFTQTSDGVLVSAIGGRESHQRTGVAMRVQPTSDIDFQTEFTIQKAEGRDANGMTTEVALGVHLSEITPEVDDTTHLRIYEASMIARYMPDGSIELRPRIVGRLHNGKTVYEVFRVRTIEVPESLRIVLKDQTLYYLYRVADSNDEQIVATYPLKYDVIARKAETWFIGSRNNGEMHALLKRMSIHSDLTALNFDGAIVPINHLPTEQDPSALPQPPSLPTRIYNSVRNLFR